MTSLLPLLFLGLLAAPRHALQEAGPPPEPAPATPEAEAAAPADAAGLTALLLERRDAADPELVRKLSNLRTAEALEGLIRFYDAVESRYMRRIALHGFGLFDGIPEGEAAALQKLADIATQSTEIELRESAVDELAGCKAGRVFLAAIVTSNADDAVRERALRRHVAEARPEEVEWYLGIYRSDASKPKEKRAKSKDERPPAALYNLALKELAFEGLVKSRSNEELVEATKSKLALVQKGALEELTARRAPELDACAERVLDSRPTRPDVRLFAAQILLVERGPKFATQLYKEARHGGVPLELAFGFADLLVALDDPSLRKEAIKNLGSGQDDEKRFHVRLVTKIPDPKVDKALLELSKDRSRVVVVEALRAMGLRGNPTFVSRLQKVLAEEREPALLGAAIEGLIRIQGSDEAWRAQLKSLTTHAVEVVRNSALEALGASKDAGHLPTLVAALEHPFWTTRLAAARGLEQLHVAAGVGALCQRMPEEEGRMASDFADILWRLTAKPFRSDGKQWVRWWEAEGADFRFPTAEEFLKRQQERDLRAEKEVSQSFRGAKVDSRFFGLRITSHHVAFVVDVSGSMDWRLGGETATEGPKRMDVARKELLACLEALEAGTFFNILPFSSSATPWKEAAVECTEETFTEAKEFVEGLGALGGTNVYDGLLQAFADPAVDTIFFLSDGEPSVGEVVDPVGIREEVKTRNQQRGVVIHTISIGERFPLLEWLATDNGGSYRTYP
ncbi:MAG: VWA domain-containing protein [Planctomycetes bacterium]|nr:VWA domain-containing protein [Planctomycetota bacterium]